MGKAAASERQSPSSSLGGRNRTRPRRSPLARVEAHRLMSATAGLRPSPNRGGAADAPAGRSPRPPLSTNASATKSRRRQRFAPGPRPPGPTGAVSRAAGPACRPRRQAPGREPARRRHARRRRHPPPRLAAAARSSTAAPWKASRADERHGSRRRVSAVSARRWLVAVASDGHTVQRREKRGGECAQVRDRSRASA
jgi:hypothetical protein